MELVRLSDKHTKSEDGVFQYRATGAVGVIFKSFGNGDERTSDFHVNLSWSDVEKIIAEFVTVGEPAAITLQRDRELARHVRAAGWRPRISNIN